MFPGIAVTTVVPSLVDFLLVPSPILIKLALPSDQSTGPEEPKEVGIGEF